MPDLLLRTGRAGHTLGGSRVRLAAWPLSRASRGRIGSGPRARRPWRGYSTGMRTQTRLARRRRQGRPFKVAAYNLLKGGSKRVHWVRMVEDLGVDLLLAQESYPHHEHLPPLVYPDAGSRSAWEKAGQNGWGSAVFSRTGTVRRVAVPNFPGWVVGAEVSEATWQARTTDPLLAFSVHAPSGGESYHRQVNKLLDEIKKVAGGREVVIGGDFNVTVSHWHGPER